MFTKLYIEHQICFDFLHVNKSLELLPSIINYSNARNNGQQVLYVQPAHYMKRQPNIYCVAQRKGESKL
jgi:hypothetical protein